MKLCWDSGLGEYDFQALCFQAFRAISLNSKCYFTNFNDSTLGVIKDVTDFELDRFEIREQK